MSVKRYDITSENCFPWLEFMEEDVDGDYVLHEDYAALLARHNALREAAGKIKKYARHYPSCNESESPFCQCGLEELLSEVDRLIASGGAADCEGEG